MVNVVGGWREGKGRRERLREERKARDGGERF